jgi:hypothetical protein
MALPTHADAPSVALEADGTSAPNATPPEAAGIDGAGAPPSNTAPANCTSAYFQSLLTGIDSLYLSYRGALSQVWEKRLYSAKDAAKSPEADKRLQAQLEVGGHCFVVHDRGSGRFAYVISDAWFRIALSKSPTKALPVAYVQVSSDAILLEGLDKVLTDLTIVLNTVAVIESGPHVSRADIRVDFVTSADLASIGIEAWVTRAHDTAKRYVNGNFSGWTIGLGGNVAARLYNKRLEMEKSRKWHMLEVWATQGWDGKSDVMRMEFQLERPALVELGVDTVPELVAKLPAIWLYCTTDWLHLKTPTASDGTATRWRDHPLWVEMVLAWANPAGIPAARRFRKERVPGDEWLFVHGLGGLTSFMATRGITDLSAGFGEFIAQAAEFHDGRERSLARYVRAKVLDKGRRFGTLKTRIAPASERLETLEAAEAYRRAKQGE